MDNADQCSAIIWRITNAINKMDGAYYFCGKKLGIKENTLTLLYAMADNQPHTQKQLSDDWLIPKTTNNTIVQELLQEELITLLPVEHSKEKNIRLTAKGQQYTDNVLKDIRQAEHLALDKTLQKFSPEFIDAFEYFADTLYKEFNQRILK